MHPALGRGYPALPVQLIPTINRMIKQAFKDLEGHYVAHRV